MDLASSPLPLPKLDNPGRKITKTRQHRVTSNKTRGEQRLLNPLRCVHFPSDSVKVSADAGGPCASSVLH